MAHIFSVPLDQLKGKGLTCFVKLETAIQMQADRGDFYPIWDGILLNYDLSLKVLKSLIALPCVDLCNIQVLLSLFGHIIALKQSSNLLKVKNVKK